MNISIKEVELFKVFLDTIIAISPLEEDENIFINKMYKVVEKLEKNGFCNIEVSDERNPRVE
jgi:hypothetical protein